MSTCWPNSQRLHKNELATAAGHPEPKVEESVKACGLGFDSENQQSTTVGSYPCKKLVLKNFLPFFCKKAQIFQVNIDIFLLFF